MWTRFLRKPRIVYHVDKDGFGYTTEERDRWFLLWVAFRIAVIIAVLVYVLTKYSLG